ncbi:small conductance mechanosensitive channel [Porphyromonadaceae bacterium KH3R12]|nr:small conductance mechanosensitive channel [Porphyromonadaceae bacterium KH3R12]
MMTLLQISLPTDSIFVPRSPNDPSFGQLIKEGRYDHVLDNILAWGIDLIVNILIAIVLFIIGRFLITKIDNFVAKIMRKSSIDNTLKGFISSVLQTFLFIVLFMIIINSVGVKTISIAAIIGTVGLAIGLAMKDNLSNFAGGVMILLSKPFRSGDYIRALNLEGTVERIGIMHTILRTGDNKTIYIPNGPLSTGNIINNNSLDGTLRTEIIVNVDYGCNVDEVKELLLQIAARHPKVLKQPVPFARMSKINPTSLEFVFRVWAKKGDLADVNHDLSETVYKQLYERGLISSTQRMSVYLTKEEEKPV